MADVIKKATRESYGEALADLAINMKIFMFWTPTLPRLQRPVSLRKNFPTDFLTAVLQKLI